MTCSNMSISLGFGDVGNFAPKATNMDVISTTATSMTLRVSAQLENPTSYSAHIPYANVHVLKDGHLLGNATILDASLHEGNNSVTVTMFYAPGSPEAVQAGLDMLSSYISGRNTTVELAPHRGSIPAQPDLGEAMKNIHFTMPMPQPPSRPSDDPPSDPDPNDPDAPPPPRFLGQATMHLFTSTASFILHNPFPTTPLHVHSINGSAWYNDTELLGTIWYPYLWKVRKGDDGETESPRLPVEWRLGGVGYAAMVDALGGALRIRARAVVQVGVGLWRGTVEFDGKGVKAGVRL